MAANDLVIRGGTVIDGTGAPRRTADVAVCDGRIAEVGHVVGSGHRTIEAHGAVVAPGWVDVHTHYDGQATWDSVLAPSSWHGVTTVVAGNCGVGFAPVRAEDREQLVELMEGVEDIPGTALHEGLAWNWETFPEYLDALEARPHDVDLGVMIAHGPLRVYAMGGHRAARREPAGGQQIQRMRELVGEAIAAGALGFSTSRTLNHRTAGGDPTPTLDAAAEELIGIAGGLADADGGIMELISDLDDIDTEFETFRQMMRASGRPLHLSLNQERENRGSGQWRKELDLIEQANLDGLPMRAQVAARGIGLLMGLQSTINPFAANPVWREVSSQPHAQQVAALLDAAFRRRLVEAAQDDPFVGPHYHRLFPLGDPPDYEPPVEASVQGIAEREQRHPAEVVADLLVRDDGRELLYFPVFNYDEGHLDAQRELLRHEHTVPGLSDGGAHVGTICDASFPTTLASHWARDRSRGPGLSLEWVVKAQARDTARALGMYDRGMLAPGHRADVNVIDIDRVNVRRPEMVFDLPAGGRRLLQRAEGYLVTMVDGEVTYENGEHTGALPGRLVRGTQPRPGAAR